MSEHTRAPWRLSDKAPRYVEARAFDDSWHDVTGRVRGGSPQEADANARLIAAAPEMYDALEATLDYWTTTGFAQCEPGCDCIVEAVRAALGKARGAR